MKLIDLVPFLLGFSVTAGSISAINLIYNGITHNPETFIHWAIFGTISNLLVVTTLVIVLRTVTEHERIDTVSFTHIEGAVA